MEDALGDAIESRSSFSGFGEEFALVIWHVVGFLLAAGFCLERKYETRIKFFAIYSLFGVLFCILEPTSYFNGFVMLGYFLFALLPNLLAFLDRFDSNHARQSRLPFRLLENYKIVKVISLEGEGRVNNISPEKLSHFSDWMIFCGDLNRYVFHAVIPDLGDARSLLMIRKADWDLVKREMISESDAPDASWERKYHRLINEIVASKKFASFHY